MHELNRLADNALTDLSTAETRVVCAAATGRDVEFATATDIRPEVIRWLCTDPKARTLVEPRGIRLKKARITGTLDLRNIDVEFYIRLHCTQIDGDVNLNDARLRTIGFSGSSCQSLFAYRAHIAGALFLQREDAEPFRSSHVVLDDAVIDGNVHLERAQVGCPSSPLPAFGADRAQINGVVFADGAVFDGVVRAYDTVVGGIFTRGASFRGKPGADEGLAVALVRTTIKGVATLSVRGDSSSWLRGRCVVVACQVGGSLCLSGMTIRPCAEPGADSADRDEPEADTGGPGPGGEDATADEPEADTGGPGPGGEDATADEPEADTGGPGPGGEDATPAPPLPYLLELAETRIGGHLLMEDTIVIEGSVSLSYAHIVQDAQLRHYQRLLDEERASGVPIVNLRSASIGKTLNWRASVTDDTMVDLTEATADVFVLSSDVYWPARGRIWIEGFRYRSIVGDTIYRRMRLASPSQQLRKREQTDGLNRAQRYLLKLTDLVAGADATQLRWLRLSTRRAYSPQPYDALAAALTARGLGSEATQVRIARADDRRRAQGPLAVVFGLPYKLLVGNGFHTWLAALWLAVLLLVDTVVFSAAYHAGQLVTVKPADQHLPFQPFVYSLDLLLPIVDLGQANAFLPTGSSGLQAFVWAQICFGWVLATAIVASAGAALRRSGS